MSTPTNQEPRIGSEFLSESEKSITVQYNAAPFYKHTSYQQSMCLVSADIMQNAAAQMLQLDYHIHYTVVVGL